MTDLVPPKPPDDLEGGVGLACSRGHDEKDTVAASGDGRDGRVDGVDLVVARRLAAAIVKIVLKDDFFGSRCQALPGPVARPQVAGRRETVEAEGGFLLGTFSRPVVEDEAVADGVSVILGLDHGHGNVGLVIEDVVGPVTLTAADQLAAHDDAPLGEADLLADLLHLVPPVLSQGGRDEFGADIAFAEAFLVHRDQSPVCPWARPTCTSRSFRGDFPVLKMQPLRRSLAAFTPIQCSRGVPPSPPPVAGCRV